ncbi:hypothetical protein Sjap_010002 [Stephania japonica]|uniref:RNase H type-1 domain-containing protein n=1 Tax=Stephania japonica TaxID=461633 RepID=A0AAP0J9K9_9MAGN
MGYFVIVKGLSCWSIEPGWVFFNPFRRSYGAFSTGLVSLETGYTKLIVESGSAEAVSLVTSVVSTGREDHLVVEIRQRISEAGEVRVQHIFRKCNFCADFLAKEASSMAWEFDLFDSAPSSISLLLEQDAIDKAIMSFGPSGLSQPK